MTAGGVATVLIGPMGAGKTSIGRRVATSLGVRFYDSDIAVARQHGPIAEIFARHGEEQFRRWERDAVRAGLDQAGVVAVGGGAILDTRTRASLAEHRVVLLTVEPAVVASRLRRNARPLLSGEEDPVVRWTQIMDERRPLYEELADVTFDTSRGPIRQIAESIVAWVRTQQEEGQR